MERGGCGLLVVGTLLGPEGTGWPVHVRGWVGCSPLGVLLARHTARVAGVWWCHVVGHLPYFENCTVDASI